MVSLSLFLMFSLVSHGTSGILSHNKELRLPALNFVDPFRQSCYYPVPLSIICDVLLHYHHRFLNHIILSVRLALLTPQPHFSR